MIYAGDELYGDEITSGPNVFGFDADADEVTYLVDILVRDFDVKDVATAKYIISRGAIYKNGVQVWVDGEVRVGDFVLFVDGTKNRGITIQ